MSSVVYVLVVGSDRAVYWRGAKILATTDLDKSAGADSVIDSVIDNLSKVSSEAVETLTLEQRVDDWTWDFVAAILIHGWLDVVPVESGWRIAIPEGLSHRWDLPVYPSVIEAIKAMVALRKQSVVLQQLRYRRPFNYCMLLWADFGKIPVRDDDCIETDWSIFAEGAHREDVWRFFEEEFGLGVADLMGVC